MKVTDLKVLILFCSFFLSCSAAFAQAELPVSSIDRNEVERIMVTFSVTAESDPDEVMHKFIAATLRQTGQVVTLEEVSPLKIQPFQSIPFQSLTIENWLKCFQHQIPFLKWVTVKTVIHMSLRQIKLPRNPIDDEFNSDLTASMSGRNWFDWLIRKFPSDEFCIREDISTSLSTSPDGPFEDNRLIAIHIIPHESVRQFLTDWMGAYSGTWIAGLEDLAINRTASHLNENGELVHGILKTTTIYCIR